MDGNEWISMARGMCLTKTPYFARGYFRMRFHEKPDIPTIAIDAGWNVYFNRDFVLSHTPVHRAFFLAHELGHALGFHHGRMGDRRAVAVDENGNQVLIWNLAADIIINEGLEEAGFSVPETACTRARFDVPERCSTVEEVYDYLLSNTPASEDVSGGLGDLDESNGRGVEGDEQLVAKQVAGDVKEYMAKKEGDGSRQAGNVPGMWQVWAETLLAPPRIRWEDKLRPAAQRKITSWERGQDTPSYSRRHRRQATMPARVVIPGRLRALPRVLLIIDSSGSMLDNSTVAKAQSESEGILRACGGELTVMSIDTVVQSNRRVKSGAELRASVKGGGGTDLVPAFEEARKGNWACIVCITDGYLFRPVPDKAIWLVVDGAAQDWMNGEVIVWEDA